MRLIFLFVLLVGAVIGYGYPFAVRHFVGQEIGTFHVQDSAGGFRPVDLTLASAVPPVRIVLDMTAVAPADPAPDQSALTLTVATEGKTVIADTLDLADAEAREDSPQTHQRIYRLEAPPLVDIGNGIYTFTAGPGDADGLEVMSVDLHLYNGGRIDERAQPIGLSIMALGFIGLAVSLRLGRGRKADAPATPTTPRWGRGAGPDA